MKRVLLVLVLSLGLLSLIGAASADLPPGGSFTDDNGNVHEANIEAIAAAGITRGCNPPVNDRYCPDRSVTRGQMAAFLVRALDLTDDGGGNTFVDVDGSVFESDIAKLAAAGITKGCNPPTNDRYCPNDPVRRDQMASFLARALKLDPIAPPAPAGVLFTGLLQSQSGLSGEIEFEVAPGSTAVSDPTIRLIYDDYDCGGGLTRSGDSTITTFVKLPVTGGSFSYSSSTLTLSGTFSSPTAASGTVSGDELMDPKCPWGPLSWSAASTGAPPPTSSTTTTTTTTPPVTTPPPPPPSG